MDVCEAPGTTLQAFPTTAEGGAITGGADASTHLEARVA